jgi:hypothetical protein
MSDLPTVAQAFGDIAKAKALAVIADPEGRTCAGCVAHDQNTRHCEPLRHAGLCQKQVYLRVELARLIAKMAELGVSSD